MENRLGRVSKHRFSPESSRRSNLSRCVFTGLGRGRPEIIVFAGISTAVLLLSLAANSALALPKDKVIAEVTLGGDTTPTSVVVSPNNDWVYVACMGGGIAVIDAKTNQLKTTFTIANGAYGVAVSPSGGLLAATSNDTNAGLYFINTATGKVTDILSTFAGFFLTFAQRGTELYAADDVSGKVGVFDTKNGVEQSAISVGGTYAIQPVVSPDQKQVYVSVGGGGASYVSVIETTTKAVAYTLQPAQFDGPKGLAINHLGTRLYVTQSDEFNASGAETRGVVVINTATRAVVKTVSVTAPDANQPNDWTSLGYPAVTRDGKYLYVPIDDYDLNGNPTSLGSTVAVINTGTGKVIDQIPVGNGPVQVAISPDGYRAYVTNSADNTVSVINVTGG